MSNETTGRSPVELFFLKHFQNMGEAAEALDLSRKTVDTWRSRPERMLKHVFLVREVTGASAAEIMDVIEETRRSSHYEE
jgi:hypothetical protein